MSKEITVKNIITEYLELYQHKELFSDKYFNYDEAKVRALIEDNKPSKTNKQTNNKTQKKASKYVVNIKNVDDVRKVYQKELIVSYQNNKLKDLLKYDLEYLYSILYKTPLKKNDTKEKIYKYIKNYFDSDTRVKSLKK